MVEFGKGVTRFNQSLVIKGISCTCSHEMNSLEASSARRQEQVVARCAQLLYSEHTQDWRELKTGRTCRIGDRLWGTGDTKTSRGKDGSQPKGLESEVEGLKVVVWDPVKMAGLVMTSMVNVQLYPCSSRVPDLDKGQDLDKGSWQICRGLPIVTEFGVAGGLAGV